MRVPAQDANCPLKPIFSDPGTWATPNCSEGRVSKIKQSFSFVIYLLVEKEVDGGESSSRMDGPLRFS